MDGENNGKPYSKWDDLGVPLFLETPIYNIIPFLWVFEDYRDAARHSSLNPCLCTPSPPTAVARERFSLLPNDPNQQ